MAMDPIRLGLTLVVAGTLAACAVKSIPSDVPLSDRRVETPPPGTPPEVAWFSGRWAGMASDGAAYRVNNALVVNRVVSQQQVTLTYGCGKPTTPTPHCPKFGAVQNSLSLTARYEDGELRAYPGAFIQVFRRRGDTIHYQALDAASRKVVTEGTMWRVVESAKGE